ncbi:MAG TPA: TonB family protein, partial [Polyangiaceae bacterium]
MVQHQDAVYPPSALAERKHADVVLVVTIDADGHVSDVKVQTSGGADLDEAAVVAARQWTFVPATRGGKPVPSRIRVPFHFAPPAPPPEIVDDARKDTLPPTSAVPASKPSTPTAKDAGDLDEVDVIGRIRRRPLGAPEYESVIGELAAVPRATAADALKLAPGFLLTNEGGSGHAEQVFLRGFDAHEGQDLEFTVDGVPINDSGNYHGNGYAG